jgi:hypothetical protein
MDERIHEIVDVIDVRETQVVTQLMSDQFVADAARRVPRLNNEIITGLLTAADDARSIRGSACTDVVDKIDDGLKRGAKLAWLLNKLVISPLDVMSSRLGATNSAAGPQRMSMVLPPELPD